MTPDQIVSLIFMAGAFLGTVAAVVREGLRDEHH